MRGIDELDVRGRRVLVRVDFNVPLATGPDGEIEIADDTRIRGALPTIEELRAQGARLVLVSHLGRPEGTPGAGALDGAGGRAPGRAPRHRRDARAGRGRRAGAGARRGAARRRCDAAGERSLRAGRDRNDPELARALAELADVYVNDAFGVAHRAHASTEGVAHLLPSAAGRLLEREVKTLTGILDNPARPLVAIVGGSKVADKIAVIDRFLQVADVVLIGGAMCFPFLCAQGHTVGESLCVRGGRRARAPPARAGERHALAPARPRAPARAERPRARRPPRR